MTEQCTATVGDVVAAVHARYDPAIAEPWDVVGLVCGDPDAPVRRILVAVDAVEATVEEALARGVDLLLTHHPLLLTPVSSVAATTPSGNLVHRLVTGGCALLAAHTNADSARGGVNDALAEVLGVRETAPLVRSPIDPAAGLGRVGSLDRPLRLDAFAERVRVSLPTTAHGVRVAGDPGRTVQRVAVISGSGGDCLGAAAVADVDVVVTSDLKHHVTQDFLATGGPAVVDVAHFASEWPWVPVVADLLASDLHGFGFDVHVATSTTVTDPWTFRV